MGGADFKICSSILTVEAAKDAEPSIPGEGQRAGAAVIAYGQFINVCIDSWSWRSAFLGGKDEHAEEEDGADHRLNPQHHRSRGPQGKSFWPRFATF